MGNNSGVIINELFEGNKIANLYSYGIYSTITLIRHKVQLMLISNLLHIGSLSTHTIAEGNMISHLIMKFHKV